MVKSTFLHAIKGFAVGIVVGVVLSIVFLLTFYSSLEPWYKNSLVFSTVFSFAWLGGFIGLIGGLIVLIRSRRKSP